MFLLFSQLIADYPSFSKTTLIMKPAKMSSPQAIANQNVKDENHCTFKSEQGSNNEPPFSSSLTRSTTTSAPQAKYSRPRTPSVLSLVTGLGGFSLLSFLDQSSISVVVLRYPSEPTDFSAAYPVA